MTQQLVTAEVLERAADLIQPEGAWTKESFARGGDGLWVSPTSPKATCFCGVGAVFRVLSIAGPSRLKPRLEREIAQHLGLTWLGDFYEWNDARERTQAEVVARLREAAARARAEDASL